MGLLDDIEDTLDSGGDERTRYEYRCDDCSGVWQTTVSPNIARCTNCDSQNLTVLTESAK